MGHPGTEGRAALATSASLVKLAERGCSNTNGLVDSERQRAGRAATWRRVGHDNFGCA